MKGGGNMGAEGSTKFLFDRKAQLRVVLREGSERDVDELEIIDAGADDIQDGADGELIVYGAPEELGKIRDDLIAKGFNVKAAELVFIPKNTVEVTDVESAQKILALIDVIDELDDVLNVASALELSDEVAERFSK